MTAGADRRGAAECLTVALDPSTAPWSAEAKYALRALLRIAGYGARFVWRRDATPCHVQYGGEPSGAAVYIPSSGWDLRTAPERTSTGSTLWDGVPLLRFPGDVWRPLPAPGVWPADLVFMTYWLLTGAEEPRWPRDRRDNLDAGSFVLVRDRLLAQAPVSRWGMRLRAQAVAAGCSPLPPPWRHGTTRAAFAFTHDVDYPLIIKWIEVARLLAGRGPRGARTALRVLRGTSHFWTFREWVDLAARFGTRPVFFFMARQGSLFKYARGVPDDFYDVRTPAFARLFAELRDAGCEIGLHASYLSHRSAETLRVEAERVAHASGTPVLGNRHHYWHLDPGDPNETLRRHEQAGLRYDSSLGLEFFPGFRRGICHPFRPFHPGERRELDIVQLPPAWMDDHFDRRLARNGIADPEAAAREILDTARHTEGAAVVDYHSRGMNVEFYPRYGPWFTRFAEREFDGTLAFRTGGEILEAYLAHEAQLAAVSADETAAEDVALSPAPVRLEVRLATKSDHAEVAELHHALFGDADFNGHSIAALGPRFLRDAFYGLNADNTGLRVVVARADGRVVGFSVYATNREGLFAHMLRRHPAGLVAGAAGAVLERPSAVGTLAANLRYLREEQPAFLADVTGWWIVAGVHPDARSRRFERRAGARVAQAMFDVMEADMRAVGCGAWYGVVRPDNAAINAFLQRQGASVAGRGRSQGLEMVYYVKPLAAASTAQRQSPR